VVNFHSPDQSLIGEFTKLTIVDAYANSLRGELIPEAMLTH
jgi:hypothetical protein